MTETKQQLIVLSVVALTALLAVYHHSSHNHNISNQIIKDRRQLHLRAGVLQFRDPTTTTISFHEQATAVEEQHIGNELCISSVRNGKISTASVIDEDGRYVNLALPPSYSTEMNIECSITDERTGEVTTVHTENAGVMVNNWCAQKSFQPGKFAYKHLI